MGINIKPVVLNYKKNYYKTKTGVVNLNDIDVNEFHNELEDYSLNDTDKVVLNQEQLEKSVQIGNTGMLLGVSAVEGTMGLAETLLDLSIITYAAVGTPFTVFADMLSGGTTNYTAAFHAQARAEVTPRRINNLFTDAYNNENGIAYGFYHNTYNPDVINPGLVRGAGNMLGECISVAKLAASLGVAQKNIYSTMRGTNSVSSRLTQDDNSFYEAMILGVGEGVVKYAAYGLKGSTGGMDLVTRASAKGGIDAATELYVQATSGKDISGEEVLKAGLYGTVKETVMSAGGNVLSSDNDVADSLNYTVGSTVADIVDDSAIEALKTGESVGNSLASNDDPGFRNSTSTSSSVNVNNTTYNSTPTYNEGKIVPPKIVPGSNDFF